ncbi:MAG TPA: hypothetical protein DHD79_04940 [Firmicutes bacterium]|nr:hypothetical protein [Bacillota bacterium]HBL68807.1 hypothetical protein [Bacillota bacterium]HCF88359.1 hypothetical protein [Bacillota bacterium]HCX70572.1 hypothetical protein [Bacillota bacterium]
MAMMRLTFTPAEFQQIVDYYGFACQVTPEQLKVYLLSLKRRATWKNPDTNTLPDLMDRETLLQELMKAESQLAAFSMKYRESEEKATLLERARGAMLEENSLLKSELRRLSWENGQLRRGVADPQAPPEIETLDTQAIIKGWGNNSQSNAKSLWDRITGK